jgi:hypothetical protein
MIILCNSFILLALNGTVPHNMAYRTTPALQISALNPEYPYSPRISGAIYAGVPLCSCMTSPGLTNLLTPKSAILTLPRPSRRILSSLMSL